MCKAGRKNLRFLTLYSTEGAEAALLRAKEAAGGLDVRVGGSAATIRQYLKAGLVDHIHLVVSPALLGSGESLLAGIDLLKLGFKTRHHSGGVACRFYKMKFGRLNRAVFLDWCQVSNELHRL